MKPYRVKRGGKFIGSYIAVVDGSRVNLATKNATEAWRRAALAAKGLWPEDDLSDASAVKQALEGAVPANDVAVEASPEKPQPRVPGAPQASQEPASAPAAEVPQAAGAATANAATAVNATAAQDDAIEGEVKAAMGAVGIDLGDLGPKLPLYLGKGVTYLSGQAARFPARVVGGRWPERPKLPAEAEVLQPVLGKCLLVKLAEYGMDLEKLGPGAWLLVLFGCCVVMQTGVALASLAEKPSPAAEP